MGTASGFKFLNGFWYVLQHYWVFKEAVKHSVVKCLELIVVFFLSLLYRLCNKRLGTDAPDRCFLQKCNN